MAQIDKANFEQVGGKVFHANISGIVGVGGANDKNDVMLVQALFRMVGYSEYHARKNFRICPNDMPQPTGSLDTKTIQAIWGFQRANADRLLSLDGKLHPANYKNRTIKNIAGRLMAITLLNFLVADTALMFYNDDVISGLKKIAPELVLKPYDPWA